MRGEIVKNKSRIIACLIVVSLFSACALYAGQEMTFNDITKYFADKNTLKLSQLTDLLGVDNKELAAVVFSREEEKSAYYNNICKSYYSDDKSLLVFEMSTLPMGWEKVFVVFEKKGDKYFKRDILDSIGKYKKSEFSFITTKNNAPVFSITNNSGGTGTETSWIVFYKFSKGKTKQVLKINTYGHDRLRISCEYSGEIQFSDTEIKINYDIKISSPSGYYESTYKDCPIELDIFKTKKKRLYKWDNEIQKYIYYAASSELPENFEQDASNAAKFYKIFGNEIEKVKESGDKYQREWAEKMFIGASGNTDKSK